MSSQALPAFVYTYFIGHLLNAYYMQFPIQIKEVREVEHPQDEDLVPAFVELTLHYGRGDSLPRTKQSGGRDSDLGLGSGCYGGQKACASPCLQVLVTGSGWGALEEGVGEQHQQTPAIWGTLSDEESMFPKPWPDILLFPFLLLPQFPVVLTMGSL